MNDSRNELTRERRRNEELTRLLRESRDKTVEVRVVFIVNTVILWHLCRYVVNFFASGMVCWSI